MAGRVGFRFTSRRDGDLGIDAPGELARRRRGVVDLPWSVARQVHGIDIAVVAEPGGCFGATCDGFVTAVPGAAIAVQTADCGPVLIEGRDAAGDPVVGAVHAGWRGLYDGVLESALDALVRLGARDVTAVVGPCISASRYEFGAAELARLALRFGPDVVAATAWGTPAFDLSAAIHSEARRLGIALACPDAPPCTAATVDDAGDPAYFSWRARADTGRQSSVIWIERDGSSGV
ncbi:MAG TPA: polyphenol oxidase family protein [Microthrixaceae bacterium]|nr:polyphenol oxidase family protein [Microthrixaceae bacterium]HMT25790.1 polyphenol oxidase family protein [Microthrixaceae bacterium]HMT60404.1 polyphenol oxidase family protein [Microthrixaceae bacterium]